MAEQFMDYVVTNDDERDLKFRGMLLAEETTYEVRGNASNRWQEMSLYRTVGGDFVCSLVCCTRWQGEQDVYAARVCASAAEVVDFFGLSRAAKRLYAKAGIDATEQIA